MRSWSRVARWLPVDEQEDGFGWAIDEPLERTSHALRVDGRVWLIDPVDAPELEDRIRALGEPAGVLQLLDRHARDGAAWAARLGVPLVRAFEGVAGTPFQALPVLDNRFWREVALWEPQSRTLLCADVLGTLEFFRAGERAHRHAPFCCDSRRRARSSPSRPSACSSGTAAASTRTLPRRYTTPSATRAGASLQRLRAPFVRFVAFGEVGIEWSAE